MVKGTGKVALGKKVTLPFIFLSYRMVIDVQDIWFPRIRSKISEKKLFSFLEFWGGGLNK